MINVANTPLKSILIVSIAIAYVMWGTGWELPILNIPPSFIFVGLVFITIIFIKDTSIKRKDAMLIVLYIGLIILMSLVSLPVLLNSDDYYGDLVYLMQYDIKLIIGTLSVFAFTRLFTTEKDIKLLSFAACITAAPIIYLLFYKYILVWDMPYMGVDFSNPEKMGKNSFAMALTLIGPYFFINYNQGIIYKLSSFFAVIALLLATYYINSRAMVIITGLQLLIFLYFSGRKKILVLIISAGLVASIYTGLSIEKFLVKRTNIDEQINIQMVLNILSNSHRGRLTKFAIEGIIDTNFLGNGIATYRYKQAGAVSGMSGINSRTLSHNDILTVLYEQGIFGFLILGYFIFYRLNLTHQLVKKTRDPTSYATLISLYGLILSMIFANFITSLIPWMIIGLNISVCNILDQRYRLT